MNFTFFGEVMLRLTPSLPKELLMASDHWTVNYAGAEANVATSLAKLGHTCQLATKFPDNLIGDKAVSSLRKLGVDTEHCARGGERIGTYFIELGDSIRPTKVVYDRQYSAFSMSTEADFDWQNILKNTGWLFIGGISLALSEQCAKATIDAAKTAKALGVKVAFDMNFRRTLWQQPELAKDYFSEILTLADLAFGNAGVMADVFELPVDFSTYENNVSATISAAHYLQDTFNVDVAFTVREHVSASNNRLSALYLPQGMPQKSPQGIDKPYFSTQIDTDIVDRLGTGDAFAAAVLHGVSKSWPPQEIVSFANASFALAHTQLGDHHLVTESDIQSVTNGNTSGHVIR